MRLGVGTDCTVNDAQGAAFVRKSTSKSLPLRLVIITLGRHRFGTDWRGPVGQTSLEPSFLVVSLCRKAGTAKQAALMVPGFWGPSLSFEQGSSRSPLAEQSLRFFSFTPGPRGPLGLSILDYIQPFAWQ